MGGGGGSVFRVSIVGIWGYYENINIGYAEDDKHDHDHDYMLQLLMLLLLLLILLHLPPMLMQSHNLI